ncbi:pro-sigmaK processing inhibitor BofA family protein [Marinicrinis lubricantis]|uniref:Pro-sigmaK processing inhibitor BofA family protein n=1 Tax=Marinicrinis lubricantis TaxID=2086470 RepID=A0ABW1IVE4_9BACL
MTYVWIGCLSVSLLLLVWMLLRKRGAMKWLGYAMSNIALAGIALYLINGLDWLGSMEIAINFYTIGTIVLLGLPGLLLISAVHWFII